MITKIAGWAAVVLSVIRLAVNFRVDGGTRA